MSTWREAFAPKIAFIISECPTMSVKGLKAMLNSARPDFPPTSHQFKIWGNEAARQLRDREAGLGYRPFAANKPVKSSDPNQNPLF